MADIFATLKMEWGNCPYPWEVNEFWAETETHILIAYKGNREFWRGKIRDKSGELKTQKVLVQAVDENAAMMQVETHYLNGTVK